MEKRGTSEGGGVYNWAAPLSETNTTEVPGLFAQFDVWGIERLPDIQSRMGFVGGGEGGSNSRFPLSIIQDHRDCTAYVCLPSLT